jgi:hypothetical protein
MPVGTTLLFLLGAALLVVGMGFFTLGADTAMMPLGEGIGAQLTRSNNIFIIILISLIMGTVITIAEPDLRVLADQLAEDVPVMELMLTVGIGVGIFLVIAVLRTLFKIRLSVLLIIFYIIAFLMIGYIEIFYKDSLSHFIPVAFDSGGVTTGPMTVPFILAMSAGVASIRSDKDSQSDSFGMVALCSVGPIIAVLVLGLIHKPGGAVDESALVANPETSQKVVIAFINEIPQYTREVVQALGMILIFFVIFQLISRRFKKHQTGRILIGFVYTFIGLVVFLTGVSVGFMPAGRFIGHAMASSPRFKWLMIPLSMVIGYFIVNAEPAVHVLNKQVEDVTSGAITAKVMLKGLSVGMAIALALTMVRIFFQINILYILVPGYAIAVGLTFFVPKIFTGIAFDSGGVCSGPMTSTFLLPLAIGAAQGSGLSGTALTMNAFGIVAMVAMTPLVVIQIMGVVYGVKTRAAARQAALVAQGLAPAVTKVTLFDENQYYSMEAE